MPAQNPDRKVEWFVWGGLALVIAGIVAAFVWSRLQSGPPLPVLRSVSPFTLTNQLGGKVSLEDLRGQVWVADIIFTRCPGPCARMTKQFSELQSALSKDAGVKLVSLTADPEYDTPSVLKQYGEKYGARAEHWWFLTGPKKEIYDLALDSLMLAVQETRPEERASVDDLFVHSTIFVLVDKKGSVRAVYESTEPDTQGKLLRHAKQLLGER